MHVIQQQGEDLECFIAKLQHSCRWTEVMFVCRERGCSLSLLHPNLSPHGAEYNAAAGGAETLGPLQQTWTGLDERAAAAAACLRMQM